MLLLPQLRGPQGKQGSQMNECMTPEDAMSHSSSLVILQPEIRLWQVTGWNDKISDYTCSATYFWGF